jgi:hypothetical protein
LHYSHPLHVFLRRLSGRRRSTAWTLSSSASRAGRIWSASTSTPRAGPCSHLRLLAPGSALRPRFPKTRVVLQVAKLLRRARAEMTARNARGAALRPKVPRCCPPAPGPFTPPSPCCLGQLWRGGAPRALTGPTFLRRCSGCGGPSTFWTAGGRGTACSCA